MGVQAAGGTREYPASDRAWSIETNGINVVPDSERHGKPSELFRIRCVATRTPSGEPSADARA